MSLYRPICVCLFPLAALLGPASAQEPSCVDQTLKKYAVDGKISLEQVKEHLFELKTCSGTKPAQTSKKQSAENAQARAGGAPAAKPPENGQVFIDDATQTAQSNFFFLRKDFTDLGLFKSRTDVAEAEGATLSYTDSRASRNSNWSAQGIAGFVWQLYSVGNPGLAADGLIGVSVAPYVSFDTSRNSSNGQISKDRENYVLGGAVESAVRLGPSMHFLRLSGGEAIDNVADTRTPTATFEWIPAYQFAPGRAIGLTTAFGGPGDPLVQLPYPMLYRFTPEFRARYDTIPIGDGSSITRDEFRYGGQAALFLGFLRGKNSPVPDVLQRITSNTSYSWLYSEQSHRKFQWLQTSLSYRLDQAGNVALTGTYKNGRVEQTTKQTDEYTVGLSAKW